MSTIQRHDEVVRLVARVRRRWRMRVALRGLAITAVLTVAVLFLSATALERLRFSADAVVWLRVLTWGTFLGSLAWFLVRPLLRRVGNRQVALYLEEHEPSLDHAVVSALEADPTSGASSALMERLVRTALDSARQVDDGRRVDQRGLYRFGGILTAAAVAAVAFLMLGPAHLRTGLGALLSPTRDAASVNPYSISVAPGDATVARGTDQMVTATLAGFDAGEASVFTRTGPDASFQRLSMLPDEQGGFEALLIGVSDRTEYFVESSGVRSPTYAIDVADLPYVDRLDLTYRFPSYTGLSPRTVENGGDVAALPGTVVEVRITPTIPAPGGRLVLGGEDGSELSTGGDGTLVGTFTVRERGFYSVELARDNGELVAASPEYTIDVLDDQEPSIRFTEPGRDMPASPIEEVYLEMRADDDYGVGDLRLVYSVNGGPEDTVSVFQGSGSPLPEVSAGHTLFLEEFSLEPGDLVSYYGLVRDNRRRGGTKAVASDIYFLQIRPFDRTYRQGESGGMQGGGGAQMDQTALSELQRQIIAATFNLIRQEESYASTELSENIVSVALAQERLKGQVATLLERMGNRGIVDTDPAFRDVSAVLPLATEAMDRAKAQLDDEALRDALPHEQTALRYLQQAEETYERYVVQQQQGGGGGGGGQSASADELADLFELELDKLKNQYETVRRGQQQTADDQVDESLEKLKELARRQQQEAERQRRRAQAGQSGGQGGSDSQRDLAQETEEAARELRRLARETNDAQLEETARNLQEAADAMRRAASQSGNAASSQAASAQERLDEARRRLEQAQQDRARRDAEEALERVDELQRQQRDVQRDVRGLPQEGQERTDQIARLRERKDQMTDAVAGLERDLDRASQVARSEQPEAARKLGDAAQQIRESKLKEKLQYSRGTIEQWDPESATTLELNIEADLQTLRDRLEEAADAAGQQGREDPMRKALEDTRELVRGMESMDRRLREPSGQQGDQQGQQGDQQGQQGDQQGQQGDQRGQQGDQQGQQGDQQGQQGDQQGQQGDQQGQQGGQQGQQGDQQGQQGQQGDQQGQQGQQGGQQGQRGGQPAGGGSDRPTEVGGQVPPFSGDGATRGDPRRLSDQEVRQFRRELGVREGQVRDLRNQLNLAGGDAAELNAVLEAMRRLQADPIYDDPEQVAALQEQILESLKRLEFGLRREVEGPGERRSALSGSDDVPDEYRKLVEEYYRKLAGGSGRNPGGG